MTRALMAVAVVALAAASDSSDDRKSDLKTGGAGALVGTYTITALASDGRDLPPERGVGNTVRFTETTVTVTDKDRKETFAATYTLDASKTPVQITMTSTLAPAKGAVARGLIRKQGDTVALVYALPGGEMPTTFTTKEKQNMIVMKKAP
jgi:uncharacterized protein (TIGR03067 family)